MNINTLISFMETSNKPLDDFTDRWKKRYPDRVELVNSKAFQIIKGSGFTVCYETPHDCGCEYCEEKENQYYFVENKKDLDKKVKDIMYEYDLDEDEISIENGTFFIKAVKQNKDIGGLFKTKG